MQHISDRLNECTSDEAIAELNKYHCCPTKETRYQAVRDSVGELMKVIFENCPQCEDRNEALKSLRMVRMWANSAIALEGVK